MVVTSREIEGQRIAAIQERAPMQKLFITGHLLPGADISAPHITRFLEGLGPVCGMNIFNGPHVKTPDSYDPETFRRLGGKPPEDVNGAVMWDDSGVQIYVFPTRGNWFTLDVHTCKAFDANAALEYTYEQLGVREDMQHSSSTHEHNTPWQPFVRRDGKPLNPEITLLPEIDALFETNLSDRNEVIAAGHALEGVVTRAIEGGLGERVAASYTPEQRAILREIHSMFEIAVDDTFMDDVLGGEAKDPQEYPFQSRYNKLSAMEAQAARMQKGYRIMHIGTGWPGTAIGLYQQFGIPVTCVEIDPEVARKSKMALEKLGLYGRDNLQIVLADGSSLNTEEHSTVILSAMLPIKDKTKIVRNMRRLTGDCDSVLILRTPPDRARSLFYQELPDLTREAGVKLIADTGGLVTNYDHLKSFVYKIRGFSSVREGGSDWPILEARRELIPVIPL